MSLYKKDIARAIIVVSLVAALSIGTYSLFPDVLPRMAYATGATIQDDAPATADFIDEILESGGAYISITFCPSISLTFENGTEYLFMTSRNESFCIWHSWSKSPDKEWWNLTDSGSEIWGKKVEINASELQRFNVNWGDGFTVAYPESKNSSKVNAFGSPGSAFYGGFSGEFENLLTAGNLSWHGNYNKGSEINTTLHVDSTTTDLGTRFENNYLIGFSLDSTQINSTHALVAANINGTKSKLVSWDTGSYWGTYGYWSIQVAQLSQMVGQSESASISFEGTVWLDGDYTVTENDVARDATLNSSKNVSFGTIDVTSSNGAISMLSFDFNPIDIILFAYPQED
jgi:hypothetical protein